jgi:hypothetical protein
VLASETILLAKQSAGFAYAVGEAANRSLDLINKTVQGTF